MNIIDYVDNQQVPVVYVARYVNKITNYVDKKE